MADQAAIDRRPPGGGIKALGLQPVGKGAGPPAGMLGAQRDDAGLDDRAHLVRARLRLAGAIHEPDQTLGCVLYEPLVDGLAADPVASCHVGHRGAVVRTSRTA